MAQNIRRVAEQVINSGLATDEQAQKLARHVMRTTPATKAARSNDEPKRRTTTFRAGRKFML